MQNPDLKVFRMTGYMDQREKRKNETEDFLPKPFSADMLLRKIGRLLHRGSLETFRSGDSRVFSMAHGADNLVRQI